MSTRCQVQVIQEAIGWEQRVTLYHHCDGYPSAMLPLFEEAYVRFGIQGYQGGRAGHSAAFLCAVDPEGFEPEDSHTLHGDIEYYYRLFLVNQRGGSLVEQPVWMVEIFEPSEDGTPENPGTLLMPRTRVENAGVEATKLELG